MGKQTTNKTGRLGGWGSASKEAELCRKRNRLFEKRGVTGKQHLFFVLVLEQESILQCSRRLARVFVCVRGAFLLGSRFFPEWFRRGCLLLLVGAFGAGTLAIFL